MGGHASTRRRPRLNSGVLTILLFIVLSASWWSQQFRKLRNTASTAASAQGSGDAPLRQLLAAVAAAAHRDASATGVAAVLETARTLLSLRGPVVKAGIPQAGMLDGPATLAAPCLEQQRRYEAALGAGQAAPPEGPCVVCKPFVNHRYRVVYLRLPKAGSTAAVTAFTHRPVPGGLERGLNMTAASADDLRALWRDYYVFTVLRDPFERAVSIHSFVARFIQEGGNASGTPPSKPQAGGCAMPSWDEFCEDPNTPGALCAARPACCPGPSPEVEETMPMFVGKHSRVLAKCIGAAGGGLAVDYVARQEHLAEDLAAVVAAVNARRDPGLPALDLPEELQRINTSPWRHPCNASAEGGGGNGGNNAACSLQARYSGQHAHCLQGVARFFADDLRLMTGLPG